MIVQELNSPLQKNSLSHTPTPFLPLDASFNSSLMSSTDLERFRSFSESVSLNLEHNNEINISSLSSSLTSSMINQQILMEDTESKSSPFLSPSMVYSHSSSLGDLDGYKPEEIKREEEGEEEGEKNMIKVNVKDEVMSAKLVGEKIIPKVKKKHLHSQSKSIDRKESSSIVNPAVKVHHSKKKNSVTVMKQDSLLKNLSPPTGRKKNSTRGEKEHKYAKSSSFEFTHNKSTLRK
jgi:hypothetical protein